MEPNGGILGGDIPLGTRTGVPCSPRLLGLRDLAYIRPLTLRFHPSALRMNVEVFFTANSPSEDDLRGTTVVAIDVLRACSTIVTALANGAKAVIPVSDMVQAGRLAANLDADTGLLGGERGGKRIDGFQVGNSPAEYTPEAVHDRTVVLTTTNGTQTIAQAKQAHASVTDPTV